MFWRLYLTILIAVMTSVLLVGIFVLQREYHDVWTLTKDMIIAGLVTVSLAIPIAYFLARRITSPLEDLAIGALELSRGNFEHEIETDGTREVMALAGSFNTMKQKLAATFELMNQDREQLRTILSGMVEGVVAYDNEQRVLFANERVSQLLEFPAERAVGHKLWELTRQSSIQALAEKALRSSGPHRQELDWHGPTTKSLAVYASRLPGRNSAGAVMVVHDITELRRLERLRQDFVANVSHELKTPLSNIKSSVEVLIDGAAEDATNRSLFLHEIDLQANRLEALVVDLLRLARIEGSEATMQFQKVEIEEAVYSCLDRHRTRAEAKGHALNGVALGGSPPDLAVWADEEGLAQILDNLVDNAIKYTPEAGRVTVRWQADAQQVSIEVSDTGIGIPERDLPRVFERFYRVDKARSREMGGTGLGLAIVKHTAQAMKGTVRVTSVYGEGTTFRVTLPRSA